MSMEQNEKRDIPAEETVTEQTVSPEGKADGQLSEEEKREILSVFAETNENKHRKSFRFTIKNQIILVVSVLVIAGILLGSYFLFLKEEEPLAAFYAVTDETLTVLDDLGENVTVTFCNRSKGSLTEEADPDVYRIYTYATLYDEQTGKVDLKFDSSDGFDGVKIKSDGKTLEYAYTDFYVTRGSDGATYGFDGERIFTNAILELTGKETLTLAVRPLDGYDADGDTVLASGGVVMFPMVARSDIAYLEVENEQGSYTIYQDSDGTFYFLGSEFLTFNAESFASLLVDCRYVVTAGKLEDQMDLSIYGFGNDQEPTCQFTLMTVPGDDGYFYTHTVMVGKKAASGSYYYAMYFGTKMNEKNEVLERYYNQKVYMLPYGNVETNLLQPVENFFDAQIVNGVEEVNDVYSIDYIEIDFYDYDDTDDENSELHAKVLNLPVFNFSDNTSSDNSSAGEVLKDKKTYASSGLTYSDWTGETDSAYLVGLVSSDGAAFTITAAVTNVASDGIYDVTFGLARDDNNAKYAALLPENVSIRYSSDGVNYKKLSNHGLDFSAQADRTVKDYTFRIESSQPILLIEISFTMPDGEIGYLVMDELRIMADGEDAVPNDALTGVWRLISPSDYLPEGKMYAYLDSTNFSEFMSSLATLEGDSVAKIGISERGENYGDDIIHTEMLAEFGLDRPAMHFSYMYEGYLTDLYFSEYDEEDACYYVYSTITGDVYGTGKDVVFCTGLVARVSLTTAPWLEWDILEYIDHSLVGMYVYEIEEMTVTYGGQEYVFKVTAEGNAVKSVTWNFKEMDEESFRYFYLSIVQVYMRDEYTPSEGETPEEYLRIKIKTTTDQKEYVFYRVSSSRAYYTVNGSGMYYCRISSLRNVVTKLEQFIAGEKVGK